MRQPTLHSTLYTMNYELCTMDYKMKSGADWILFGIPVVAGIVSFDYLPIEHELLKWLASAGITILCFAISVWIKEVISDK